MATTECLLKLLHVKYRAADLGIPEATDTTVVYNDNEAAVSWATSVTNKGIKHINLRKTKVREIMADGHATVVLQKKSKTLPTSAVSAIP